MLDWILYTALLVLAGGNSSRFPASSPSGGFVIPPEFFGMHLQCVTTPCGGGERYAYPAGLGFGTLRLWDTVPWAALEPQPGVYRWNELDWLIREASGHGVKSFVFTLGAVPAWASANPNGECGKGQRGQCYPPDLRALDDFLTTFVRRECGIVQYYEGWNEPNQSIFWRGSNAQLLTVTQHLYSIARNSANCGCAGNACSPGGGANHNQVLTSAVNTICCAAPRRWMAEWLALAERSGLHADIVSFHGYESEPEQLPDDVAWLRQQADAHGLNRAEIWDTESSWGRQRPNADEERDAGWLMRSYITHAAGGVSRFYWYAFGSCSWGTLYGPSCGDPPDHRQGMRKPGIAYQTIARWLTGATVSACSHDSAQTWSCSVSRSNGYKAVLVWNAASSREIKPPAADYTQYRDWQDTPHPMGKTVPISPVPLLLENSSRIPESSH